MKDNSNNIRAKYVYDAWGNHKVYNASGVEQTSSTFVGSINPIRYRGYYYDTESDMYYCKSRYYKPQINRWINMDVISVYFGESRPPISAIVGHPSRQL